MGDNELDIIGDVFLKSVSVKRDVLFEDDGELIKIEMLRVGKFNSDVYGELDITHDMLDKMVDNFYDDVIGREVSFDWNHKAENASAWLKDIEIDDGKLIGSVEMTKKGKESVENKEYGYFSIEYSDDFKDKESGDAFGPAITGGALTNRPFISNLKKIEFEDKANNSLLYRLTKGDKKMADDKTVVREPAKEDEKVSLEELQAKNKELSDRIDELNKAKVPEKKKEVKAEDDGSKKLEDFILAQKDQMKILEDKLVVLEDTNKELKETSETNVEKARVTEINSICDKFLNDDKHHPVVVETARKILLSDKTGKKSIKLSETTGEGDAAKTIDIDCSITDAVVKLMDSFPDVKKSNYDEETTSTNTKLSENELSEAEENGFNASFRRKGLKRLSVVNSK